MVALGSFVSFGRRGGVGKGLFVTLKYRFKGGLGKSTALRSSSDYQTCILGQEEFEFVRNHRQMSQNAQFKDRIANDSREVIKKFPSSKYRILECCKGRERLG
jgi:hypothetical protein